MECYCYMRNIQHLLSDGKTHRVKGGSKYLFMVVYHLTSAKDLSRLHQFGPKVLSGIFLGYALHGGGESGKERRIGRRHWGIGEMDASEIYANRLNKKVSTPMSGEKIIFPIADGTVQFSVGDKVLRAITSNWDRPDRGEEQGNLQGESDGSSSTPLRDSSWYGGDARNDLWFISVNFIYRHHVKPRVKLCVPREESSLIPLKYRRYQDYRYILGCNDGEKHRWLLERWWRSRIVRYVDGFHSIYFLNEKPPDG